MELHRGVKREEEDRGDQGEKRGIRTRETDLASNSLSVLHSLEHPKIFTELGREEGERRIKPVNTLLNKNGY